LLLYGTTARHSSRLVVGVVVPTLPRDILSVAHPCCRSWRCRFDRDRTGRQGRSERCGSGSNRERTGNCDRDREPTSFDLNLIFLLIQLDACFADNNVTVRLPKIVALVTLLLSCARHLDRRTVLGGTVCLIAAFTPRRHRRASRSFARRIEKSNSFRRLQFFTGRCSARAREVPHNGPTSSAALIPRGFWRYFFSS